MKKHRSTVAQLQKFATDEGITLMGEFDLPLLRKFRNGWKDGPLTAAKKLERLRAFFRYAEENKWIDQNPAAKIRSPKLTDTPTMEGVKQTV